MSYYSTIVESLQRTLYLDERGAVRLEYSPLIA